MDSPLRRANGRTEKREAQLGNTFRVIQTHRLDSGQSAPVYELLHASGSCIASPENGILLGSGQISWFHRYQAGPVAHDIIHHQSDACGVSISVCIFQSHIEFLFPRSI